MMYDFQLCMLLILRYSEMHLAMCQWQW